jgi:hypothetical protein
MSVDIHSNAYVIAPQDEASAAMRAKIRAVVLTFAIALGVSVSCVLAVLLHVS